MRKTEENNFHKYKDNWKNQLKIKVKEEEKQYIKEKQS